MEEFFMSKNTNYEDEMIFFDAEIVEDDGDDNIPMGTLVNTPVQETTEEAIATDITPEENMADAKEEMAETPALEPSIAPAKKELAKAKPVAESKPKTTPAPKKQVNESDIWGVAVINTKKAKAETPAEEPKTEEKKPAKTKPVAESKPKTTSAPKKQDGEKKAVKEEKPVETKAETEPKAETKTTTQKNTTKKTSEEEPKVAKEIKAPEEQIIQEGTREYHGKFVIKKTDKGHFVYKLFAYGNKCVAIGAQAYEGLGGVKGGIASVARIAGTAPIENQTLKAYETLKFPKWEIYADKKGEFRLRLYASNGNLVATTNDGYLSVQAAKKGIESVAKAADGAAIVRNDNAW